MKSAAELFLIRLWEEEQSKSGCGRSSPRSFGGRTSPRPRLCPVPSQWEELR
jgi:hypothetical protein